MVFLLNFFELYLILLQMIFFHRILHVSFSSMCLKILFFLVANEMLRDALNSNEHQFVFMCLSMALLRHSQFFSEISSLFCIIFFTLCLYSCAYKIKFLNTNSNNNKMQSRTKYDTMEKWRTEQMLLLYIKFVVWKMNQPLLRCNNNRMKKMKKKKWTAQRKKWLAKKNNGETFSVWWAL